MNGLIRHIFQGILLVAIAICPLRLSATALPIDSILALPEDDQVLALSLWLSSRHEAPDQLEYYREVERLLIQKKKDELACIMRLHHTYIYLFTDGISNQEKIQHGLKWINELTRKGKDRDAACMRILLGSFQCNANMWGPGFEMMISGYHEMKKYNWPGPYLKIQYLERMALAFYKFGDFESSLRFSREAYQVGVPPVYMLNYPGGILNTIALSFRQLQELDSAIYYFNLALQSSHIQQNEFFTALVSGNLGHVYYLKEDYEKALPLLEEDYHASMRLGQKGSAANAAQLLADIALQKGELEIAEAYMKFSGDNLDYQDLPSVLRIYSNLFSYYKNKGETTRALLYADSIQLARKRIDRERDARILEKAKLRVQVEQYNTDVASLEAARQRQVNLRNGVLATLGLTGIMSFAWISRLQYRRKKEEELNLLREKNAAEQLIHAQTQLNIYIQALMEKNDLVQSFRQELHQMQHADDAQADLRISRLANLTNAVLITDDDWRQFRQHFEQVYPGFFIKLKEKLSDLTPAETRLLALTKLQITPRDMADMLGISADSIKKSRHRLRKKLNLPEDGTLEELVELI